MKFTYTIQKGQIIYDDPVGREAYLRKQKDGTMGTETLKQNRKTKTEAQLGYYWGVLFPAIHDYIMEAGWTKTVKLPDETTVERPWNEDDTKVWVKDVCSLVGDDGARLNLSDFEMDVYRMSLFIENVLRVCAQWGMDMDALEARRPPAD